MITVGDIAEMLESWAPRWIAWERDNVGLQVGDRQQPVRTVLVALDFTDGVLQEAIDRRAELIVTHHPLLFRPPSSLTSDHEIGRLVMALARKGIALYSAHTNLDFTRDGVSFALAARLGLGRVRFLRPLSGLLAKIAVFVPTTHEEQVRTAMAAQGAGTIGEYTSCSFAGRGTGTFLGSDHAKPFTGTPGVLERVEEARLEMLCPRTRVGAVVEALKQVHPYEEVAYDVYPLENESIEFGNGALGELESAEPLEQFLERVKHALSVQALRYGGSNGAVRRVAVCGGAGSELLEDAVRSGADAFVTADVKYHTFQSARGRIALIDAGHYETEHVVLTGIVERLERGVAQRGEDLQVLITNQSTNPVHIA